MYTEPLLSVDNAKVRVMPTMEILGITFDQKLRWKDHVQGVATRARQRLGQLSATCGRKWGVSPDTFVYLYKVYIRPILEYGSEVWGDASRHTLARLDSVQH